MKVRSEIARYLVALLAFAFLVSSPESLRAEEKPKSASTRLDTLSVKIFFHVGKSNIDLGFCQNGKHLDEFVKLMSEVEADPARRIAGQHIVGYASPEGPYDLNRRLSRERADNLADYLRTHYALADSLLTVDYGGINWEGLYLALESSSINGASSVRDIITSSPELSRNRQLMNLNGGRTWKSMLDKIFPELRYSASVVCYIETLAPAIDSLSSIETRAEYAYRDEILPAAPKQEYEITSYPVCALRTNLLLPLLNFGVEVPVSNHWSAGLDYYYPWLWPNSHNKNCFELLYFSAEARYWFDGTFLSGHSVGAYGTWGYYDFERNYHGYQGDVMSVGIDYLYSMPIADGSMRLEFEAALGAIWSYHAQPYNVYVDGGKLIREKGHLKNFSYFGPSRVAISLVVPIDRKVITPKKR